MTRLIKLAPTSKILPGEQRADCSTISSISAIVCGIEARALRRSPVSAHTIGIAPARGATDMHGFGSGLPGTIAAAWNTTRHGGFLVCIFLMTLLPVSGCQVWLSTRHPGYAGLPSQRFCARAMIAGRITSHQSSG